MKARVIIIAILIFLTVLADMIYQLQWARIDIDRHLMLEKVCHGYPGQYDPKKGIVSCYEKH